MTLEEKAKAYDNAFAKARDNYKTALEYCDGAKIGIECFKNTLALIFPELKESEDERTKGAIIYFISHTPTVPKGTIGKKTMLAWLEKQGVPTEINPSEFDLRLNKLLKQFETLPKEELANSLSFYLNVVQNDGTYKEQGNYEFNGKITSRKSKGTLKTLIDEVENKQLSQSQVTKTSDKEWSEEDEELLNSLVKEIESELKKPYFEGYDLICNKKISWLKSLKERISL